MTQIIENTEIYTFHSNLFPFYDKTSGQHNTQHDMSAELSINPSLRKRSTILKSQ